MANKRMPYGSASVRTALTQSELECAVDEYGIGELLCALSRICDDKADYISASYSDEQSANWWKARAVALNELASAPFMQDA